MIVKLHGGLSNQMFQYAFGRSVSYARNEELFFDKSSFDSDTLRHYELDAFDLPIRFADETVARICPEYVEKDLRFDSDVYKALPNSHFKGYWQSEKYFDIAKFYGGLCCPKGHPSKTCAEMGERISHTKDSCLIGVRRGDYLRPERINYHGVMPADYYCLANLQLPVNLDREYFVFTDDIPWVKENLPEFFTVVDVNGPEEKAWDIWLGSLCKHAIIANSTFHWWQAWIGPDKRGGKIVAPALWFANGMKTEIVPERWTKI